MRKNIAALALCGAIALGGCAGTTGIDPTSASAFITQVQRSAVDTCGFLPTFESVAQIAATAAASNSAKAGVELASTIASLVCSAVTATSPTAKGARLPRVYGVRVHGKFVR